MSQQHEPLEPRGYQEEMTAKALRGNSLLVAPTGCGKTKIIAMVLDDMWGRNPAAKVDPFPPCLFCCLLFELWSLFYRVITSSPTFAVLWRQCQLTRKSGQAILVADRIPLVLQQARNLKKWCKPFDSSAKDGRDDKCKGPNIGSYHSNNPYPDMTKSGWTEFLERHDLFVFTPAMLSNLIRDAELTSLNMFDYFVIDEAHHTIKSHPFNGIMMFLKGPRPAGSGSSDSQSQRPKILAVTATVGGRTDQEQSFKHLQTLADNLNSTVIIKVLNVST